MIAEHTLLYDGSYEGLLTAIFEVYQLKLEKVNICAEDRYEQELFAEPMVVETHPQRAERVRQGLIRQAGNSGEHIIYRCYLSEREDLEYLILHIARRIFKEGKEALEDYGDPLILRMHQVDKQLGREVHRMHAFVRFQRLQDDTYVSLIEPDFNVLPLLQRHFVARYPAQNWLIYDTQRHYGLQYDSQNEQADFTAFAEADHRRLESLIRRAHEQSEGQYQQLWRTYFKRTDIPERRNMKLHLQHVPRRYWKYLVEKRPE